MNQKGKIELPGINFFMSIAHTYFNAYDKKVFGFINTVDCSSLEDLESYLIKNDLPFLSRWAFYCLGKFKLIDDSFSEKAETKEGENFLMLKLKFWDEYYFNNRWEKVEEISKGKIIHIASQEKDLFKKFVSGGL